MSNACCVRVSVSFLLVVAVGLSSAAAESLTEAEIARFERRLNNGVPVQRIDEHGAYQIEPLHLPLSILVDGFFNTQRAVARSSDAARPELVEQMFGSRPGGRGQEALTRAAEASEPTEAERKRQVELYEAAHRSGNDAEWKRLGRAEAKFRRLGEVWAQFVEAGEISG